MDAILNRMKEPSSHAGIALLLQAAAFFFPQYSLIIQALSGLFGFTAIALPEKKQDSGSFGG